MTDSQFITMFTYVVYFIIFLICVGLTRWIFGIGALVRHTKAQTKLLSLIAQKSGADEDVIKKIVNAANEVY